jgi:cytochrome c oxidase subunit 2
VIRAFGRTGPGRGVLLPALAALLALAGAATAGTDQTPSILRPASPPAQSIHALSLLVFGITAAIFLTVLVVLVYTIVRFRRREGDPVREPPQVYGSVRMELAWTIVPLVIVLVLFLSATRTMMAIADYPAPPGALRVTVVGHQWWWEYRYPELGVVTAGELHLPVSEPQSMRPVFLSLESADVIHSFWVPRLAGKTDVIPGRVNHMWMAPLETGLFLGQCAEYCGLQHAGMLIRVVVETPDEFERWVEAQRQPAVDAPSARRGRELFASLACVSCHRVRGTEARGDVGPDLTHLMSRQTLGSGVVPNTPDNLSRWVADPAAIKPGVKMPAMGLDRDQLDEVVRYLETLR